MNWKAQASSKASGDGPFQRQGRSQKTRFCVDTSNFSYLINLFIFNVSIISIALEIFSSFIGVYLTNKELYLSNMCN